MKKILSIVLALMLAFSLMSCGSNQSPAENTASGSQAENQPANVPGKPASTDTSGQTDSSPISAAVKDTIIVRTAKDIGDLNPHTMKSQMFAQDWVYESLVGLDNGEIVPRLAESWELSPDGLTYTFHLRPGVKFSDGSSFTSALAKRNIEAVQNHAESYSFLNSLAAIESIDTPDDLTLILNLSTPCNSLLNDFTFSRPLTMLAEKGFPANGDPYDNGITAPIGTGKWVLREHAEGQYAIFERNEYYWGNKPNFQYLKAVLIPDVNTAASALEAGEIDVMMDYTQITADIFNRMAAAGYQTSMVPTTSVSSLNINTGGPITSDRNVRLALEYATDNTTIADSIFGGLHAPATGYFTPEVAYADTGIEPYAYDPDMAGHLLEEAGWNYENGSAVRSKDGQKLELDLIYDSSVTNDLDIGLILQSQYSQVGIQLNIVPQDSQIYRQNWASGNFDVLIYSSWGGSYEPFATLAAMASEGDKFHTVQAGMSNKAQLDQVMLDCLSQNDPNKLQENFQYITQSFHDEAVYVPLTIVSELAIYSNKLTGLEMNSNHYIMDVSSLLPANYTREHTYLPNDLLILVKYRPRFGKSFGSRV